MDLVFFRSGGARYGIDATVVLRVARMTVLTPLHGVPGPFLGVMAWPGGVLPVANIERLLSQAGTAGAPEGGMVLVVGSVRPELAVLAGEVEGVESVSVESVRAVGDSPGGLVRGALPDGTLVVDGRVLLADSLRAAPESRNGNQKT
jgi:chemotaxis signal transduction protein